MTETLDAPWTEELFEVAADFAREFNEFIAPERVVSAEASAPSDATGDRPGDDFNRRARWEDILEPHGWKKARQSGNVTYWTRPGKDPRLGCSATTGKCSTEAQGDLLYVFSSSADKFQEEQAYSKFAATTLLNFNGDYGAAARKLREQGFGGDGVTVRFEATPPPPEQPDPPVADETGTDGIDVAGINDLKAAGAELKWVWPDWIQQGVVVAIAAEGGTGKTRLMADLVRRVRHGINWPDGTEMTHWAGKTVALWVVADNHHDEMVSLSEAFGIVECIRLNAPRADPYSGVTLEVLEDFVALEKRIALVKPLFVVIDTVGNATDKSMSRQEDAKAFYAPLQIIARRQKVAVMALTHLNASGKALGRRVLEKVRVCLRMSAPNPGDKDCKRRLEVIKSNSKMPAAIGVQMGDTGNEYDDKPPPGPEEQNGGGSFGGGGNKDDPANGPPSKCKEAMDWLTAFLEHKPYRVSDLRKLAENKGIDAKTLYKAMRTVGLEEFESGGYKWWRLPGKGDG